MRNAREDEDEEAEIRGRLKDQRDERLLKRKGVIFAPPNFDNNYKSFSLLIEDQKYYLE